MSLNKDLEKIIDHFWGKKKIDGKDLALVKAEGITLLTFAVLSGYYRTVNLLLSQGFDINGVAQCGLTALMVAAIVGNEEAVIFLIERDADINKLSEGDQPRSAIHWAAFCGHTSICQLLITCGADITELGWTCNNNTNRGNVLHLLMMNPTLIPEQKFECAKVLWATGKLHIDAVTSEGNYTALSIAAKKANHETIISYLLGLGASTDIRTKVDGNLTALEFANAGNHYTIAQLIEEHNRNALEHPQESIEARRDRASVSPLIQSPKLRIDLSNQGKEGTSAGPSQETEDLSPVFIGEEVMQIPGIPQDVELVPMTISKPVAAFSEYQKIKTQSAIALKRLAIQALNEKKFMAALSYYDEALQNDKTILDIDEIVSLPKTICCFVMENDNKIHVSAVVETLKSSNIEIYEVFNEFIWINSSVETQASIQNIARKIPRLFVKNNEPIETLFVAVKAGLDHLVKVMLPTSAGINRRDQNGRSALIIASNNGHLNIVKYLISQNADIQLADNYGRTPLMSAASSGHLDVVIFLVKSGAEINKESKYHETAMTCALDGKHFDIESYLCSNVTDSVYERYRLNKMAEDTKERNKRLEQMKEARAKRIAEKEKNEVSAKALIEMKQPPENTALSGDLIKKEDQNLVL